MNNLTGKKVWFQRKDSENRHEAVVSRHSPAAGILSLSFGRDGAALVNANAEGILWGLL